MSRKYPAVLATLESALSNTTPITHLYLDCNSLVYDAIHTVPSTVPGPRFGEHGYVAHLIRKIVHGIEQYVAQVRPTECVFIAFDGVAPRSKMDHQRSTRLHAIAAEPNQGALNEAEITPGTAFMDVLTNEIHTHFKDKDGYVVSATNEPGEGEQKIFAHLRSSINRQHTAVIYGLDADLLMLGLAHIHLCTNIFVIREKPPNVIISGQPDLPKETLCATNIRDFAQHIETEMAALCRHPREPSLNRISGLVQDYVVLCFFLGNDFLPQFPSLNIHTNAIPILLETYAESIGTNANAALVQNGQLNWFCVKKLLEVLAKKEPELLAAEIVVRDNMATALRGRIASGKIAEDVAYKNSFPLLYREAEENIRPSIARWKSRYYTAVFGDTIERAKLAPKITRAYFKMLDWVFHYYTSGITCWMMTYEYIGAPLLTDLSIHCPRTHSLPMCNVILRPMSPLAQLVYVLPRPMHYLLPPPLRKRLASPKYSYLYPTNPIFRGAFCQWTRSARAELPPIPDEFLYI